MDNVNNQNQDILNIMLIEDDFDHAELTKRIISNLGKTVKLIHVKSGEKALDYLLHKCNANKVNEIDLIILDLRLPGIDGIDILKRIKETKEIKGIPVMVLSTSGFNHDKNLAKKHKANYYLVKPLDQKEFIKTLKELKLF
ncbi:MAG: response regulator [Bacteroidetes bacterium]|nr:response regulator [Bacteroidota bacterium]